MSDRMTPVPMPVLIRWILNEYGRCRSVFGIPEARYIKTDDRSAASFFGNPCALPVGPAAGPHTQMAQNIVASYLTGGRFFELKTVQKLDELELDKPCIDATDEGYNTEWSTEFSVEQALDEYIKAWIALHVVQHLFQLDPATGQFVFNMSVGYDLDGIRTSKIDAFINAMTDASTSVHFREALAVLTDIAALAATFRGLSEDMRKRAASLTQLAETIPARISDSVTLSTMHGCPPEEIEAIAGYLMREKGLHTYVKLNPTLLGYDDVQRMLNLMEFDGIQLDPAGFEKDLQWEDAVPMLKRLQKLAEKQGVQFGVKLSNTLAVINTKDRLPGEEMYMSGRSLYPITSELAARVSRKFAASLPISFSGGANQANIADILSTGIRPVTVATELLKPGGYLRLAAMSKAIQSHEKPCPAQPDAAAIRELADNALKNVRYKQSGRPEGSADIHETLPLLDCFAAPCRHACPIHQDVPEYVHLVGQQRYVEALDVIYRKNPLPHITGYICDHQCMFHCTRLDYDESVQIRELKRIAAENGYADYVRRAAMPERTGDKHVAILGAGPAGLACAWFLARGGIRCTLFEREADAGGIVRNVLPGFRIPVEAMEKDIDFIRAHGVEIEFDCEPKLTAKDLFRKGFDKVVFATGAPVPRPVGLSADSGRVLDALEFLHRFNTDPKRLTTGKHVVIVGGGNTAMDSARAALRVDGVETVTIIYRRTESEMPADREEFHNAMEEGAAFKTLLVPEILTDDGMLTCRLMELGEPDDSGRPRPEPTDETLTMPADTVIAAIGELPDRELLDASHIEVDDSGRPVVDPDTLATTVSGVYIAGDARRGPSTVVQSIADGRRVAEAILDRDPEAAAGDAPEAPERAELLDHRGVLEPAAVGSVSMAAFAEAEARRCLQCEALCNKCVEVCPNRANVLINLTGEDGETHEEILHLDALCNECGNCDTFCPYHGAPNKDKFTLFATIWDFENSEQSGFVMDEINGQIGVRFRVNNTRGRAEITETGTLDYHETEPEDRIKTFIETVLTDYSYLLI